MSTAAADTRALFAQLDAGGREMFLDALTRGTDWAGLRGWSVRLHRPDGRVHLELLPGDARWSPDAATDDVLPVVLASYAATSEPGPPSHLLGVFLTPS